MHLYEPFIKVIIIADDATQIVLAANEFPYGIQILEWWFVIIIITRGITSCQHSDSG
jgi:hypothetical protein